MSQMIDRFLFNPNNNVTCTAYGGAHYTNNVCVITLYYYDIIATVLMMQFSANIIFFLRFQTAPANPEVIFFRMGAIP